MTDIAHSLLGFWSRCANSSSSHPCVSRKTSHTCYVSELVELMEDNSIQAGQAIRMSTNRLAIASSLYTLLSISQAYIKSQASHFQSLHILPTSATIQSNSQRTRNKSTKMGVFVDIKGNATTSRIEEPDLDNVLLNLGEVAKVFLQYNMHREYAISYLHHTFGIDSSMVMVHKRTGTTKDCIPLDVSTLDMTSLKPHTYHLHDGVMRPLEFEYITDTTNGPSPRPEPPPEFLAALVFTLQSMPCGHMMALCPREQEVMSSLLINPADCGGAGGLRCEPFGISRALAPGQLWIDTQWKFDRIPDSSIDGLAMRIAVAQSPSVAHGSRSARAWPVVAVQQKSLVKHGE